MNVSNRAIFQVMGLYALLFAFGAFLYLSPGFFGRHGHDSLRPGMSVAEVLRETRGRYAAYAGPESDRQGRRGFSIRTYGIVRDDAERDETTGGLRTADDLPGKVENEMKKEPGSWDLVFCTTRWTAARTPISRSLSDPTCASSRSAR